MLLFSSKTQEIKFTGIKEVSKELIKIQQSDCSNKRVLELSYKMLKP